MIPDIRGRLERIFSNLDDVDCILIINRATPNPSFYYITGVNYGLFEGSVAIAERSGEIHLLTSGLDKVGREDIDVHIFRSKKKFETILAEIIEDCKVIGFDGRYTSYEDYRSIKRWIKKRKVVDIGRDILLSRLIKDKYEVEMIRRACKIADGAFLRVKEDIKENMEERELALRIEMEMRSIGADDVSFDTIVAFGRNSSIPHYVPGNKRLKKGEIVLLDFGARYRGYISDITRTFVYGRASREQREMFEVVYQAQQEGVDAVRSGERLEDVHNVVFRYIEKTKFKGKFIHSSGHTIGLEVHDGFILGRGVNERFHDGVTFTIEPGVYLKKIGGVRIEDDFVLSKGKAKRLTKAPIFLEM